MEAPTPPPPLAGAPTNPTAAVSPDSIDSSPRSRQTDSWDADPPPPQKLRLMCSYGGHIVPRPHDKTLCYIGGDTRIIVIDRHTSLADLRQRFSKTLLHNQPFTLKYQLPNEDLDSLISVTTDEDLENMVEEYDRLNNPATAAAGAAKSGRLRLFLFPKTSSNNIEQLLVETASTKSEDWFFNALNGKASTLSAGASDRGLSESSSINCLLGLDDDLVGKTAAAAAKDVEAQIENSKSGGNGNSNANNHDVNSVPDSPMLETTSSFGSTSSTPSVANLPPIRVHVEENPKVGIEDQLQQMNLGVPQKLEEAGGLVAAVGPVVSGVPVVVGGDYPNLNRVISDDERSEQGGYRKPQQIQPHGLPQLPIPQFQQRQPVAFDLASPDSVSSEGSMANPLNKQRQAMYQESILQLQSGNARVAVNQPDQNSGDQNNAKIQMQPTPQIQESSGYILPGQQYEQNHPQLHQPQQQFIHPGSQYISAGPVPITSYYPIYPPQQQNHLHQPAMDQQYPFYFIQARHTHTPGYNIPMQQANYNNELAPNAPSQTPPSSATPLGTFNQAVSAPSKPEMSTGVYRTAIGSGPQLIQVPSSQHQAQYVGFSQIHHPSQSVAANSSYAYELTDPNHAQMYYNQALPPQLAAHYQTLTSAPAVVVPDASGQVPSENIKQQVRNLQQ
ncbi:octicosapeptide/Phox/Bem1p family protein [Striga asiatica]|uniref:Octicosapeptide/Phox/Bem1p family protein n=1 Tax=Striga asiatica TaxID=4170 RepID=A0A5A7QGH7_STRAF|nr:octicosapeptide/Phox/Bem1p family protein [Striga asiatica]